MYNPNPICECKVGGEALVQVAEFQKSHPIHQRQAMPTRSLSTPVRRNAPLKPEVY